jgi:hypothetical protein
MPGSLPQGSTEISHDLFHLAQELTTDCPEELGREIILTCSVAKGYADSYSDIELAFLVDEVKEPDQYEAWLSTRGAVVDPATFAWGGGHTTRGAMPKPDP